MYVKMVPISSPWGADQCPDRLDLLQGGEVQIAEKVPLREIPRQQGVRDLPIEASG
jgi:hypothetical protein